MDIAKRQEISEKYLEAIVASLSKNGFVRSLRGKGGGYQLLKDPSEYTIRSILRLTEGSLAIDSLSGNMSRINVKEFLVWCDPEMRHTR